MRGVFWYLMPIFVLLSGNFSPYRIGPILPIFLLMIFYVVVRFRELIYILRNERFFAFLLSFFVLYSIFVSFLSIEGFAIRGNEFNGAIDPILYSTMGVLRYVAVFLFAAIVSRFETMPSKTIYLSVLTLYMLLIFTLMFQATSFILFDKVFGYIYDVGGIIRYGGVIGEPQTLSAWIFSSFFFLHIYSGSYRKKRYLGFFLLFGVFVALLLTRSTAWIIVMTVFMLIHFRKNIFVIFLMLLLIAIFSITLGQEVLNKIAHDLFIASERSVTILAGYELFSLNLFTVLFGYGQSLSPYLLVGTNIFETFPQFNLSDLGRQNVMNSYFEIFFELGIFGMLLFFTLVIKALRLKNKEILIALIPLFLGVFSIGGGFSSAYFILFATLIAMVYCKQSENTFQK